MSLQEKYERCRPCEQKVIILGLLDACKKSSDLNEKLDCVSLSEQYFNKSVDGLQIIEKIVNGSVGTSQEERIKKVVTLLD